MSEGRFELDPVKVSAFIPKWRRLALASANKPDGIRIDWMNDAAIVEAGMRLWFASPRNLRAPN